MNHLHDTELEDPMRKARVIPEVSAFTRHRNSCPSKAAGTTVTGCTCPKWLRWYQNGQLKQISADTYDGAEAKAKAAKMNEDFRRSVTGEAPKQERMIKLEDAVAKFLETKRANTKLSEKYHYKLTSELTQFANWALGRGLVTLASIRTEDIVDWRNKLVGAQNTRAKKVFRLTGFFTFCVELGWIPRNIAQTSAVRIPYDDDHQEPRVISDEQLAEAFAAIRKLNHGTSEDTRRKLRSMMTLMRWTGLSVRDAMLVERSQLSQNGNGYWRMYLRRAKTDEPVYAVLRDDVVKEILAGANQTGRYFFLSMQPKNEKETDLLAKQWAHRMMRAGELADLKDEDGQPLGFTSHWLRHSFVSWCLNRDLTTEDIAALLGDSVQVVEKYYSDWIRARQNRLEQRMMTALA
jgi:site-specific recombinase XerD